MYSLNFYFLYIVAIKKDNYKSGENLWSIGAPGTYVKGTFDMQQVLLLRDKCKWK